MNLSILNDHTEAIKDRSKSNISYNLTAYILILLLISIGFYPALDNQFVHWDDQYYVTDNIYVNQPKLEHLQMLFTKVISLNYHPITMISLWLNSFFFGVESASPFILTNIIIHALTSCLIYIVILQLLKEQYITAFFTAMVFAIHPMHVESVVWVSERKDVLYAFFLIASLWAWLKYINNNQISFYLIALGLFILSCLSKAMAVSLVPILFLIDIYKNRPWWKPRSLLRKIPFLIISLLVGIIAINVQKGGNFYGLLSNTNIDSAIVLDPRIEVHDLLTNVGYGFYFYLKSYIFPTEMSAFHPYSSLISNSQYGIFIIVPFLILGFWVLSFWLNKTLFLGIGFFIATIILVMQWIPVGSAIVSDRYTYLPYIGLSIIVGYSIQLLYSQLSKLVALGLIPCITMPLLIITHGQSDVWHDHTTLFTQAVRQYPQDPKTRMLLATGQWTSGEYDQAIANLEYVIYELGVESSDAYEKLGNCYDELGELQKAVSYYNQSIELNPTNYVARYHRGLCTMNTNPLIAIEDFNIAESSGFEYIQFKIYGPRGVCYGMTDDYTKAIEDLTKAINLGQDLATNYKNRAITYEKLGMIEEADNDWNMIDRHD